MGGGGGFWSGRAYVKGGGDWGAYVKGCGGWVGLCPMILVILPLLTSMLVLIFLFLLHVNCLSSGLIFSIVDFCIWKVSKKKKKNRN